VTMLSQDYTPIVMSDCLGHA